MTYAVDDTTHKKLYPEPVAGVPIVMPDDPQSSDEELIGYELISYGRGRMFTKPRPTKMSPIGWASVVLLSILCWPLAVIPCCMTCSYNTYQRPVFKKKIVLVEEDKSKEDTSSKY